MNYLNRFNKTILAEPFLSANILTDIAQKLRVSVLTTDIQSYYLPREAFTRPPRSINIKLGVDLAKYQSLERIRERQRGIRVRMEQLKESEMNEKRELTDLELKRRDLDEQLRPYSLGKEDIDAEIMDIDKRIDELEAEIIEAIFCINNEVLEVFVYVCTRISCIALEYYSSL